jgi:hypothetical protein
MPWRKLSVHTVTISENSASRYLHNIKRMGQDVVAHLRKGFRFAYASLCTFRLRAERQHRELHVAPAPEIGLRADYRFRWATRA